MKRIFHPWNLWEDYRHNFYGGSSGLKKEETILLYRDFLADLDMFELALQTIIEEWPYSCEHNLTNTSLNRVAYMGQAACALVFKVPSSMSSSGYNLLTDEQKISADAMAQKYIDLWATKHETKLSA
jgi:hypothetical protein